MLARAGNHSADSSMASRSSAKTFQIVRNVCFTNMYDYKLFDIKDQLLDEKTFDARLFKSNPIVARFTPTAPNYVCNLRAYTQAEKFDNKNYRMPSVTIELEKGVSDEDVDYRTDYYARICVVKTAVSSTGGSFHPYPGYIIVPLVSHERTPTEYSPSQNQECVSLKSLTHVAESAPPPTEEGKKKRKVEMSQVWAPRSPATFAVQILAVTKNAPLEDSHVTVWDHADIIKTYCFTHERTPPPAKKDGGVVDEEEKEKRKKARSEKKKKEREEKKEKADGAVGDAILSLLGEVEEKEEEKKKASRIGPETLANMAEEEKSSSG